MGGGKGGGRGRDQTHDFSSTVLFFRSQLNGTRIIFIIVAIIIINYSSYPWSYESIKNIGPFMLDTARKYAHFWAEVSSAALSGLSKLCFVQSTTCCQPSVKGGGPSGPHPHAPVNPSYNTAAAGGVLALSCLTLHYFLLKTVSFWM